MFSLKPHHLILFVIEVIVFPPHQQVNKIKTQQYQRDHQSNYEADDSQPLTSQLIIFPITLFDVDILYHVDKG